MRTLAFASRTLTADEQAFANGRLASPDGLTLLGICAISDPVRADVPEAVRSCLGAGIDVKIVTGDTPGTAREIARQIGLLTPADDDSVHITGADFAAATDEHILSRLARLKIMSRARPMDKERLVRLLQQQNHVVAVTGDGTNDAPALNAAQVGLSMGDGTSVAKEASDITILDNSFAGITRAVLWGRSLYRNIQRFILFQMTINLAACLIVFIGAFLGTESPLTVTQMLWVNLIMDTFAALALASLPPDPIVMRVPPRRTTEHIITPPMARRIIATGLLFLLLLFALLQYFRYTDVQSLACFRPADVLLSFFRFDAPPSTVPLTPYELSLFFTFFVFLQFWNIFNAKAFATARSAFAALISPPLATRSKSPVTGAPAFLAVAILILLGQVLIVSIGGEMFNVVPLAPSDWLLLLLATSPILLLPELYRLLCPNMKQ
jgi:Ca2+-transporting ATPase